MRTKLIWRTTLSLLILIASQIGSAQVPTQSQEPAPIAHIDPGAEQIANSTSNHSPLAGGSGDKSRKTTPD
jgi:hypothetical protein